MTKILTIAYIISVVIAVIFIVVHIYKKSYPSSENRKNSIQIFKRELVLLTCTQNINTECVRFETLNNGVQCTYLINKYSDKCVIIVPDSVSYMHDKINLIRFLYSYASVVIFDYSKNENYLIDDKLGNAVKDLDTVWKHIVGKYGVVNNKIVLYGLSFGITVINELVSFYSMKFLEKEYPYAIIHHLPKISLQKILTILQSNPPSFLSSFFYSSINEENSIRKINNLNHSIKIVVAYRNTKPDKLSDYSPIISTIKDKFSHISFVPIGNNKNCLIFNNSYLEIISAILD